ncbi:MAG: hypothetical protein MRERV_35c020 [Mycoplasmataceae bacterium RV_VA103A]|nr:MAG: hypothetical protein MRERV_35c020 [Mycoplasmataceae bacterium RV_VA103A]
MNLWEQLENKKIVGRGEIEHYLTAKLGTPSTELQQNLLFELVKKINSYYTEENHQSTTAYSLLGQVSEIAEKKFKEGKRRGQIFYSIRLSEPRGEKFRALKEDLSPEKWNQVQKLTILNQKLVFKYKNWLTNKDVVDFYPSEKE